MSNEYCKERDTKNNMLSDNVRRKRHKRETKKGEYRLTLIRMAKAVYDIVNYEEV